MWDCCEVYEVSCLWREAAICSRGLVFANINSAAIIHILVIFAWYRVQFWDKHQVWLKCRTYGMVKRQKIHHSKIRISILGNRQGECLYLGKLLWAGENNWKQRAAWFSPIECAREGVLWASDGFACGNPIDSSHHKHFSAVTFSVSQTCTYVLICPKLQNLFV